MVWNIKILVFKKMLDCFVVGGGSSSSSSSSSSNNNNHSSNSAFRSQVTPGEHSGLC
jgi:hypothetical protein